MITVSSALYVEFEGRNVKEDSLIFSMKEGLIRNVSEANSPFGASSITLHSSSKSFNEKLSLSSIMSSMPSKSSQVAFAYLSSNFAVSSFNIATFLNPSKKFFMNFILNDSLKVGMLYILVSAFKLPSFAGKAAPPISGAIPNFSSSFF